MERLNIILGFSNFFLGLLIIQLFPIRPNWESERKFRIS